MSKRQPVDAKILDFTGNPPIAWQAVRAALAAQQWPVTSYFLGTVRRDGRLHAAGVGPAWFDGDFSFSSNLHARRGVNLAAHPSSTLSGRARGFDLTIEGRASIVTNFETLERVAALYRESSWPAEVDGLASKAPYNVQSAGPAPWHVFTLEFDFVTACKME